MSFYTNDPYAGPIATFMRAAGQDVGQHLDRDTPTSLIDLRLRLIDEEVNEVFEAINARDAVWAAQELADVLYVVFGTAIAFGIPISEVFAAVSTANLSKINPSTGEPYEVVNGKVTKGPEYEPAEPAIAEIMKSKMVGAV